MRGKRTPVREQAARVLSYDEDSGASDTQEHRINKEELVKAAARQKRITADSIERLSVELRRFQVEVKRLQSRERDLVASVKNVTAKLDALHERYLSYERLITGRNAWCTVSHVDGLEIREDVQGALGIHKWWRK